MGKNTLSIRRFIIPLFVCVLFVPLVASAGGHGGMATGGYSGQSMMYGYGSFPSSSVNQAAWNTGSFGLYSGSPFSSLGYGSLGAGYGSLQGGYGSLYSSYPGTHQFGSFLSPSYGGYYGSAFGGFSPGYGYGYSWGGLMGTGSMGGNESGYGYSTYSSTGSGTSSGSDHTGASYSGYQPYSPFSLGNPLMYGLFVGWI